MYNKIKARRVIGGIALVALTIHVVFGLHALVAPRFNERDRLQRIYQRYFLPGPYFTDRAIYSSRHLLVGYKQGSTWTKEKDFSLEDFEYYCHSPWRYDKLHVRQYAMYAAWQAAKIGRTRKVVATPERLNSLLDFSQREWIRQPIDSISFTYRQESYNLESFNYDIDTIFAVKVKAR